MPTRTKKDAVASFFFFLRFPSWFFLRKPSPLTTAWFVRERPLLDRRPGQSLLFERSGHARALCRDRWRRPNRPPSLSAFPSARPRRATAPNTAREGLRARLS